MEPLGQSQVLQYLLGLSADHEIELISFEKPVQRADLEKKRPLKKRLTDAGISWHPLNYHKRLSLLATSYDLLCALRKARQLDRRAPFDVVHCRSYIPGIVGVHMKKRRGTSFVFDMRGFWADERVDGGIWKANGLLYRVAKKVERWLLRNADYVVSLTRAGLEEIERLPYMRDATARYAVIPTCTNLSLFRPDKARRAGGAGITVGMIGSVGSWYLFDEMLHCVARIFEADADARLLIVNKSDHKVIRKKLAHHGISSGRVELVAADYDDVAAHIACMDFGLFFIKPVFSKKASCPTKLGEYLACGVPCLTNTGVGDMDEILQSSRTGILVESFSPKAYDAAYRRMTDLLQEPDRKERCRRTAEEYFSLEKGVAEYSRIYRELVS